MEERPHSPLDDRLARIREIARQRQLRHPRRADTWDDEEEDELERAPEPRNPLHDDSGAEEGRRPRVLHFDDDFRPRGRARHGEE